MRRNIGRTVFAPERDSAWITSDRLPRTPPPGKRWSNTSPQHINGESLDLLVDEMFIDGGFAVVRHPVARFTSAFNHLIRRTPKYQDMTVTEFIHDELPSKSSELAAMDHHFIPSSTKFFSRKTRYAVFKLENGMDKVKHYIDRTFLHQPNTKLFPHSNKKSDLQSVHLSDIDKEMLREIYDEDFRNFGYQVTDPV